MKRVTLIAFSLSIAAASTGAWAQAGGGLGAMVACGPACAGAGTPPPAATNPGGTTPVLAPPTGGTVGGMACPAPAGLAGTAGGFGRLGLGGRAFR